MILYGGDRMVPANGFFKASQFEAWLAGTDRILWCSGLRKYTLLFDKIKLTRFLAGAGKSILT